ncbi:tol protein [Stagonosporopsis vannaccii]|nr:tol protein [Stagonosporopsis vannaccii]
MRVVSAPPGCKFVALSYVWGESISSGSEPGGSLPSWQLLPRTIQQCIQVTRDLDYRFLWIDRYCIRQDDSEDQRMQISQMGDIYAAAHLTVVAAAGQDPSYGLPGIFPTFRDLKFEKLGNARIYVLPRIEGLADAFYHSAWSKRAWTFQECFFSRRRLIFTDRQMIFVCNTSTRYEAKSEPMVEENDDGWLANCTPRHHTVVPTLDSIPMSRAVRYLSEHSDRVLRFDDDALNAISGALNTLAREDVYHIWGVPFHVDVPEDHTELGRRAQQGEIALAWSCMYPGSRRRKQFPSWSTLGWIGTIYDHTPVETSGIFLQDNESSISLQDFMVKSNLDPTSWPRRLRLELPTAQFAIVRLSDTDSEQYNRRVALPYQERLYVHFATRWDVDIKDLPQTSTIKGVLLGIKVQTKSNLLPGSARVLLLQEHGPHYERVGSAKLELRDLDENAEGRDNQSRKEPTYEYDGNAYKHENSADIEQTDWWRRHFTKETIILE